MRQFHNDLRYAVRQLIAHRGATVASVLSLAVGVAAVATTFTWIDRLLLHPLPGVRDTGKLQVLLGRARDGAATTFSFREYRELDDAVRPRGTVAATGFLAFSLSKQRGDEPERVFGESVSDGYFDVMGVAAAQGRLFTADELRAPGAQPVVVLSDGVWRRRYGASPDAIGSTLLLNGRPFEIIGVTPPEFLGGFVATETALWIPIMMQDDPAAGARPDTSNRRSLLGFVRANGASAAEIDSRIAAVSQKLARDYPADNEGRSFITTALWRSPAGAQTVLRPVLLSLGALGGLLLVLAAANVANLAVVHAVRRRREFAVRLALGADRWRAVAPLFVEAVLMSAAAAVAGLALSSWSIGLVRVFAPPTPFTTRFDVIRLDLTGVAVVGLAVIPVAALVGLVPALQSLRMPPGGVLKSDAESITPGASRQRVTNVLAIVQVTICFAILIATGLSVRSLQRSANVPLGFAPSNVFLASYDLRPQRYADERGIARHQEVTAAAERIPGVSAAAIGSAIPFGLTGTVRVQVRVENRGAASGDDIRVTSNTISPRYFETMGIALVSGRGFEARDRRDAPNVGIVSARLAARGWPNGDVIGGHLRYRDASIEIVGVAADVRVDSLRDDPPFAVYVPASQWYRPDMTLHVRTATHDSALTALRRAFHEMEPDLPLSVVALDDQIRASTFVQRFAATLSLALVLPCIGLTTVGIFGLFACAVETRACEIGLRVALGAQRSDIARLVVRHACLVFGGGLALGVIVGLATGSLLSNTLVGIERTDVVAWLSGSLIVAAMALAATAVSVARALRIAPLITLGRVQRS